jgi:hypothetical protein
MYLRWVARLRDATSSNKIYIKFIYYQNPQQKNRILIYDCRATPINFYTMHNESQTNISPRLLTLYRKNRANQRRPSAHKIGFFAKGSRHNIVALPYRLTQVLPDKETLSPHKIQDGASTKG